MMHRAMPGDAGRATSVRLELLSMAGSAIASRFGCWLGASGRRYTVSVFPAAASPDRGLPDFEGCVVIAVGRDGAPSGIARVEDVFGLRALRNAAAGVAEWHVHLLAEDAAARGAAVRDLSRRFGQGADAGCSDAVAAAQSARALPRAA